MDDRYAELARLGQQRKQALADKRAAEERIKRELGRIPRKEIHQERIRDLTGLSINTVRLWVTRAHGHQA